MSKIHAQWVQKITVSSILLHFVCPTRYLTVLSKIQMYICTMSKLKYIILHVLHVLFLDVDQISRIQGENVTNLN